MNFSFLLYHFFLGGRAANSLASTKLGGGPRGDTVGGLIAIDGAECFGGATEATTAITNTAATTIGDQREKDE